MFKVDNKNTRDHVIDAVLVFSLLTLDIFTCFSSVSIVEFEQVNNSKEPDLLIINESKMEISCQQTYLFDHSSK